MCSLNSVSMLQEYLAQRHLPLPVYSFSENDNYSINGSEKYICLLEVNKNLKFQAIASSKKSAKQECARKALKDLMPNRSSNNNNNKSLIINELATINKPVPFINYVGMLNEYAAQNCLIVPLYGDSFREINGIFSCSCSFLAFNCEGFGSTKKEAKQNAAQKIFAELKNMDPVTINSHKQVATCYNRKTDISNYDFTEIIDKYLSLRIIDEQERDNKKEDEKISTKIQLVHDSITELRRELDSLKINYTIKNMQKDPFIVILKVIEKDYIILGFGNTKEIATCDAIKTVFRILRDGCCLSFS